MSYLGRQPGTAAPPSLCSRNSDPQDCYSPWVPALPSPFPAPPALRKPHTYSQHLQSLRPADPSSSCKPFSHGRVSPERRKALTCLQFAPLDKAGRKAAGLAQHSLGQSNSPEVQLQLWACNQCFIQPHGRSLGPALMLPAAAGLCCPLNSGSPTVGPPGASQSTLNPAGISSRGIATCSELSDGLPWHRHGLCSSPALPSW